MKTMFLAALIAAALPVAAQTQTPVVDQRQANQQEKKKASAECDADTLEWGSLPLHGFGYERTRHLRTLLMEIADGRRREIYSGCRCGFGWAVSCLSSRLSRTRTFSRGCRGSRGCGCG